MAAGPEWPGKGGRADGTDAQNRVGAFEAEVGLLVAGVFTDAGRTSDAVGVAGLRVEHFGLMEGACNRIERGDFVGGGTGVAREGRTGGRN